MPKVLPEYLELRRQQILDAAAACFARKGFHQTTMQDICEEADLSPGAVYRYFRSKVEIIQAMCAHGHEEDAAAIEQMIEGGDTVTTLDQLAEAFLANVANRELCALNVELLSEARRDPYILEAQREGNEAIRKSLAKLIVKAQEKGEINPNLDATAISYVMMGLYEGLVHQKMLEPDLDAEAYAGVAKAMFCGDFWTAAPSAARHSDEHARVLQH